MTLEKFFDQDIEPEAKCRNCEYFDGGGLTAEGKNVQDHGDCHNRASPYFTTSGDKTCKQFFPCSTNGRRPTTVTDIEQKLAKRLEDMFMEAAMGGPAKKRRQTALRVRGRSFETVELDDAGNAIEPPAPCCHGWGSLHAPNCKTWGSLT